MEERQENYQENFPGEVNTICQDTLKYENNEIMNITAQT